MRAPAIQALLAAARHPGDGVWLRPLAASLAQPHPAVRETLVGHTDHVSALAITEDGTRVVSAAEDGTLRVWNLDTGKTLHVLIGHADWLTGAAVTSDGKLVVTSSKYGTVRVWDLGSGECLSRFDVGSEVNCVAVSQDGREVVAGDKSGHMHFLGLT